MSIFDDPERQEPGHDPVAESDVDLYQHNGALVATDADGIDEAQASGRWIRYTDPAGVLD